ncbi:hypothetical protein ACSVH2_07670 [Flavobacterium sp. RSB2_4_14]|uniref:hypothetical protein n=1 Tax=Flavobacterium sp. RSB2_4_14 TaxID=3447665 RepID=UPI003F2EE7F5
MALILASDKAETLGWLVVVAGCGFRVSCGSSLLLLSGSSAFIVLGFGLRVSCGSSLVLVSGSSTCTSYFVFRTS